MVNPHNENNNTRVQCCMWHLACVCFWPTCLCVAMLMDMWTLQPTKISFLKILLIPERVHVVASVGCAENRLMLVIKLQLSSLAGSVN